MVLALISTISTLLSIHTADAATILPVLDYLEVRTGPCIFYRVLFRTVRVPPAHVAADPAAVALIDAPHICPLTMLEALKQAGLV
ncbi:hypothetical protein OUZ56_026540 [Daphnia magna]|uniref:Secreted protein n=1 Tax=Daphnia magna TaxID=35525 RepID=A0ABQ9ZM55_9CRUS|nr:hypothetical protein OUZ56_026540 [Daphnia magna]